MKTLAEMKQGLQTVKRRGAQALAVGGLVAVALVGNHLRGNADHNAETNSEGGSSTIAGKATAEKGLFVYNSENRDTACGKLAANQLVTITIEQGDAKARVAAVDGVIETTHDGQWGARCDENNLWISLADVPDALPQQFPEPAEQNK